MPLTVEQVLIDARDPRALGRWWAEGLSWELVIDEDDEIEVRPPVGVSATSLLFVPVADEKAGKNRLHLDLRPDDQEAEVARFLAMGATHVDVGQGEQPWVVLADPEGNEFCVLRSRQSPSSGSASA